MKKRIETKILVILIIVMICLISFIGLYKKENGQMLQVLPEYKLGMKLNGFREVVLKVSEETKEVIYDSEGKISEDGLDEEGNLKEGYKKENVKINKEEILTEENFKEAKKIIEKRLEALGVNEYEVRLNNEVGTITVELPENENTDDIIANLRYKGKFEITDSQTKEVLIDNNSVKQARAVYSTKENGTMVYLNIEFNKEGKKKLEEITKIYNGEKTEGEESEAKEISINLDDDTLTTTHFEEAITTGNLRLSIGTETTSVETIQDYLKQTSQVAALITDSKIEVQYNTESNTYISSSINEKTIQIVGIIIAVIIVSALAILFVKYKVNGILVGISHIGFLAILLLIIRYANVTVSIEGIAGLAVILILNYLYMNYILNNLKNSDLYKEQIIKKAFTHYVWILLPVLITSIVFTFMNWLPIASAGMIIFWGLIIMVIYNYLISNTLLDKNGGNTK